MSAPAPASDKVVREVLADQLGGEPERFDPAQHLTADLGADDLDRRELQMLLEEKLDVELPDPAWAALVTVADVLAWARTARKST